jgi:hypothetical protein
MSSENDIQRAIILALQTIGVFAIRVQAGKVKVRGGWMQLAPAGTPDIYVLVPPSGMSLWLEVKTATGEERESQLAFATKARARGARVETVRTPQEAVEAYRAAERASRVKAAS